jgi:hypothetical protein
LQESISIASNYSGGGHYLRNELPEAELHLSTVVKDTSNKDILNYSYSAKQRSRS